MATRPKLDKTLPLRVSSETWDALVLHADDEGIPPSTWARRELRRALGLLEPAADGKRRRK